ncbi:HTH-type transcriptional regulator EthR [Acrocarpospora phusangensis]|uniref:HTH-type transcriptional regulator EthR n=1 Tax=Acrocarpospora phusangensis TaxID=1070424 RepID=A0A919QM34_9ACTN|nr:TetR/AcrR family transcriptional regulator [Acrocarpospora phusangensis]GIH28662.1 HTH-type transcriptional regulator EthR [Acrocarpospora phusangensis]
MPAIGSRRGPTKGDQRERALLEAARALFREKPFSQVTIDELANAAGIARSGFYFYFESKQAVLAALCEEVIGQNDQDMAEWLASDGLDREALRQGLAGALGRWRVDGRWLREALANPDPGAEVLEVRERLNAKGCSIVSRRIERDARAGLTVGGPPALLAAMVIKLRIMMFSEAYANPEEYTEDELLDTLTDAILRLLYGTVPESAAPKAPAASA